MYAFEVEVAGRIKRCRVPNRRANFAIDENVSVACLRAEPSGKIDHGPDRAVVAAALDSDCPERCVNA